MNKDAPCPCQSGQRYRECCQRFWASQQQPATAEQLMRSRYTAFVLEKASYLFETHHPEYRQADELKALKKSFKDTQWLGLEIVQIQAGQTEDNVGMVEFKAHYRHARQTYVLHERSTFVKVAGRWCYTQGEQLSQS
ncbi:YchJ family protein [Agitococcus lubricus]|uniref:UPF0225 protein C8N29_11063 n=1 Tax=Agitococcus lubricus TaxID=1077255 RepID=A0A2T5IYE6_9GAMM|nr:YchJ family metal-binding protein [Agitococcus lubricus]PTQ88914.1 SEC-C motif-containing protein [Agitococcus lubricus]